MNEFDNVIQKAKDIFSVTAQKTESFVNLSKQKLSLSTLYNKLDKAYSLLGKKVFIEIKNNEIDDSETSGLVNDIKNLLSEIKLLQDEIDNAEGKVHCSNCGKKSPSGSAFCNFCGEKINTED